MPKQWANMGYEIWVSCMNSDDPDLQEAAAKLTKQVIAMIMKQLGTGIREPSDLKGMNPYVEASIAYYATTIFTIK